MAKPENGVGGTHGERRMLLKGCKWMDWIGQSWVVPCSLATCDVVFTTICWEYI